MYTEIISLYLFSVECGIILVITSVIGVKKIKRLNLTQEKRNVERMEEEMEGAMNTSSQTNTTMNINNFVSNSKNVKRCNVIVNGHHRLILKVPPSYST